MSLGGTKLLGRDVAKLAYQAGWRDKNLILAVAIAHAESSLYTRAENDQNPNGSVDRGLWQINSVHLGQVVNGQTVTAENLFDPAFNATVAHDLIYKGRSYTFNAWAAYSNGAYKQYLDMAITNVGNMWRVAFEIPIPTS
jgi:hypothetical protein